MPPKKPVSSKKKSFSNNYINPDVASKISHALASLEGESDQTVLSNAILEILEAHEEQLKTNTSKTTVSKFLTQIYDVVKSGGGNLLSEAIGAVNQHRRKADVAIDNAKADIMGLWDGIASGDVSESFDVPWIREFSAGEKFMPFFNKDERYVFKGFFNQGILRASAYINDKGQDTVVVFQGEMMSLLEHDFVPSSNDLPESDLKKENKGFVFSKIKGIPSLSSLFVPRKFDFYINTQTKKRWYSKDPAKKNPPQEQIDSGLYKKSSTMSYVSMPVWSMSDIEHLISDEAKEKYRQLEKTRLPDSTYFDKLESRVLDEIVDGLIAKQVEQQKIQLAQKGIDSAFYVPLKDAICIPDKTKFNNPISRYAVWAHELSHSTMHLLQRNGMNTFGSTDYAKEEMIAETSSILLVKDLIEDLKKIDDGEFIKQWQKEIDDHFSNSATYSSRWGKHFNFKTHFADLKKEDSSSPKGNVLTSVMGGIIDTVQLIKSGKLDGCEITPELRKTKKSESLDKLMDRKMKVTKEPELQM